MRLYCAHCGYIFLINTIKHKRLFIAISLPDAIKTALINARSSVQNNNIKWVAKENLHITLHFLGKTPEDMIAGIMDKIESITNQFESFSLTFREILTINRNGRPAMIWAGFEQSKPFEELVGQLRQTLAGGSNGYSENSKHKPLPHITLARIKQKAGLRKNLPAYKQIETFPDTSVGTGILKVAQIELWESKLMSGQTIYSVIKIFPLDKIVSC